ncbi:MAG TPA: ABC transporter permease [Actinomycetota bacterium]|nr:ABC transporter permease [Actinomycetota bacterium]
MAATATEPRTATGPPPRGDRRASVRKRLVPYGLLAPGGGWLVAFFLLPLGIMVYTSLTSGGVLSGGFRFTWEWGNYAEALTDNRQYFARSLVYSGIVTGAALLLAYPLAYWIAFRGGRWKSSLLLLVLLPFFVSFIIRTIQWKFILGDVGIVLGPLKDLGLLPQHFHVLATPFAVIAGITYNFIPFTTFPLYVALERIDRSLVEAAMDLYASRAQAFWKVVFPLSLPGVFAAVILTFVPATGDYINADILGNPETTMIGNIIQRKFLLTLDYPEAAALSIVLMVGMVVLASIYARILGTEDEALAGGVA